MRFNGDEEASLSMKLMKLQVKCLNLSLGLYPRIMQVDFIFSKVLVVSVRIQCGSN